jgi:hypothetical protein
MKKIAVFTLVLLMMIGGVLAAQDQWWRITDREGGRAARNNQVTYTRGDGFLYVYFDEGMPGGNFDSVRLTFTADNDITFIFYAAYTPNQVWGGYPGGTRGAQLQSYTLREGLISSDLNHLNYTWHDGTRVPFAKDEVFGLVIRVNTTAARTNLTVTNVEFLGLQR